MWWDGHNHKMYMHTNPLSKYYIRVCRHARTHVCLIILILIVAMGNGCVLIMGWQHTGITRKYSLQLFNNGRVHVLTHTHTVENNGKRMCTHNGPATNRHSDNNMILWKIPPWSALSVGPPEAGKEMAPMIFMVWGRQACCNRLADFANTHTRFSF